MPTGDKFPSALLIDSGCGWLGDTCGGSLAFSKPDFTLSSGTSGSVILDGKTTRQIKSDPVCEIEKKTAEGYFAVGFFSYEYLEKTDDGRGLAGKIREKTGGFDAPLLSFHFYRPEAVSRGGKVSAEKPSFINGGERSSRGFFSDLNLRERRFLENVNKIKSYIKKGDVYQVNISEAWEFYPKEKPLQLFLRLFDSQPVPFAVYMDFGCFQFLSGSMELFLEKTGNKIISRPIKGTIRRGENPKEDCHLRKTLAGDEKEKAEILMITDLMRNDLSRVCVPSTVKTRGIFNIKPYKTLFHMESEIEGILRKNISVSEIIKKTFPPGSVTGAPKTKALEIIDSLEAHPRGPYCGAAGIFCPNGDFCLSVSIRCLQFFSQGAFCWSGAGIVWDSNPEKELEETSLKLKALINAAAINA